MLLLISSVFAWDPPRVYLGGHLPITGLAFSSTASPVVELDLVPIAVEYRLSPRWGLRLSADSPLLVGIRTPQTLGAIIRVEAPAYLGDFAPQDGMRGFYVGPYVSTDVFTTLGVGGGATVGISSKVGERVRIRSGLTLGATYDLTTEVIWAPEWSFVAIEVGGFLF